MSLFGTMTTAISGLTAQSRALGHVSDNVANSQTVGFKRVDTNFVSYITESRSDLHEPGSVQARPAFQNALQGTVQQSDNPLAMAITGQGFFTVSRPISTGINGAIFDDRQYFTRAGDFKLNDQGYLENGAGYYLQAWGVDANSEPVRTQTSPIRINDLTFNPIATGEIAVSANLPAGQATPTPVSSQVNIYDRLGVLQSMTLTWTPTTANSWTLDVTAPGAGGSLGTIDLNFGIASSAAVPDGTVGEFANPTGVLSGTTGAVGDPALVTFNADFGQGPQPLTINLGSFGTASGITQYASAEYTLRSLTQDGQPLGAYSSISIRENGDVAINYTNGQQRVVNRIPLAAFNDPDQLQRIDGQAFVQSATSGEPRTNDASSNGLGRISVGATENSNVDIASEFSKLIVAQRAYTANTKLVTTADELLQDTINMKR